MTVIRGSVTESTGQKGASAVPLSVLRRTPSMAVGSLSSREERRKGGEEGRERREGREGVHRQYTDSTQTESEQRPDSV